MLTYRFNGRLNYYRSIVLIDYRNYLMLDFTKIYLSWRKGQGSRRHLVGLLEKTATGGVTFSYDKQTTAEAAKDGFTPYTELPDLEKVYDDYAMQVFSQRLMKPERPDIQSFYGFWEIDSSFQKDSFYLLGHTQALLPTDNFEMLAEYNIHPQLHFLTELASTSHRQLPAHLLQAGDELRIEKEPGNAFDTDAVKVYKATEFIGYIKKVHCKVFSQPAAQHLHLTVKAVEKNGTVKKAFIKVAFVQ